MTQLNEIYQRTAEIAEDLMFPRCGAETKREVKAGQMRTTVCTRRMTQATLIDSKAGTERVIHFCMTHGKRGEEVKRAIQPPVTQTVEAPNPAVALE